MKRTLRIIVQTPHVSSAGKFVELFRNSFELDDSLVYDYQGLLNGVKLLFPNKELIINLTLV